VIGVAPETSGVANIRHPDFYMPLAMASCFRQPPEEFFEDRDDAS